MASGTMFGGGGDKRRWTESGRPCRRKKFDERSPSPKPEDAASSQLFAGRFDDAAGGVGDAASDDSSSRDPRLRNGFCYGNGGRVKIGVASRSRAEIQELRLQLAGELDQVRSTLKRVEVRESQLRGGGYSRSQMSAIDGPKRATAVASEAASVVAPARRPSVASPMAGSAAAEKEKRPSKAKPVGKKSDGRDKGAAPPSKKLKTSGGGSVAVNNKLTEQASRQCMSALMGLIKHRHGWVFDKPVDVKGLGLHDYHKIIKHPMDLGTVKSRLENNWYKSPKEFAEDVRLTFHNAMTYNPKGQDVHLMAQQLLKTFDDKWSEVELNLKAEVCPPPLPHKPAKKTNQFKPPASAPETTRKTVEKSESTTVAAEGRPAAAANIAKGRVAAPKKPKAKDPYKRNMTYDEKQRLSSNLLSLPSEKLDNVVQIIKKRNSALNQQDDEIEVDIDSFDAETLWELDRFVTNYKKSLSKNKKKALQGKVDLPQQNNVQQMDDVAIPADETKEKTDEKIASPPPPPREEGQKQGAKGNKLSSSSSSSSGSGSSSTDSDETESSSAGSDAGH